MDQMGNCDEVDPFASMLIQQNEQSQVDDQTILHQYDDSCYDVKQEISYDESMPELKIESEMDELRSTSQIKLEDDFFFDSSQLSSQEQLNDDSFKTSSESDSQTKKKGKTLGRPRGSKSGQRMGNYRPKISVNEMIGNPEKLPKMKTNLHTIKLAPGQIEELKKVPCFFQPGVCFQIAPDLDRCKECYKKRVKTVHRVGEVECRFYQFRKLRYNEDKLEVAGFLDPLTDPIEIDKSIWIPNIEKRFKSLSVQNARLILIHVGEQLCQLFQKEKFYYEKFKSDEKPIIWKRLIEGVVEICDLCATTLFNFHFICTKCGLSLCIDCVSECKDNEFKISCSSKDRTEHSFDDLSLTQIIIGDCMEKLMKMFHDACQLWEIDHDCEMMKEKTPVDQTTRNIVKNLLLEIETGKTVFTRELPHKNALIDVDLTKFRMDSIEPESDNDMSDDFAIYFNKFRKTSNFQPHLKPIKHTTSSQKETVISISRSMSQATSDMLYPEVPHRWLCENKLLRLMDPLNVGNEAFFHEQWQRGQPVLVSNVLNHLNRELWIPQAFSTEFGHQKSDFVNCMSGNVVRNREISLFWDGFENVDKRMLDNEGRPMLLKLKDWPPDSDFRLTMPTRFEDIMKNLPMNAYTNRTGDLNIVKYLPSCFLHPDLGPKGYFAYGDPFYLKEGTTNLHLDVSDACNVMCYIGFPRGKNISNDEFVDQGFKAILEADCDISNVNRVIKDGEIPGAIWHIYEACDADRIRDFLLKIASERGFHVADNHDVIHDQNWYLDGELRARLYKEYCVKGYAIIQCLGDCIILPAGTPHQVRNIYSCIKIAEDFVSPQQVGHCLNLSNQFRQLTKTHTNNEEKLNIKNVAYHSVKEAIATLEFVKMRRTVVKPAN